MAIKWRCTLCGGCCTRYVPLVLPEDVHRIQQSLDRPLSSFLTFYGLSDFHDPIDPSDERFFVTRHGRLAMGLTREESADGVVGCVFLRNNMCSIHTFKPLVCNQYPFEPSNPDDINAPFKLLKDHCFGNSAADETVDEDPIRRNYRHFKEKQDEYVEQVREWNANPQSHESGIEDFLLFVGLQWN